MLTLGIFGSQTERLNAPVETNYQVKRNYQQMGPIDQHPYEEYNEETISQDQKFTTSGDPHRRTRYIKLKKNS